MMSTNIEQSKKLVELGINPSTADMSWIEDFLGYDKDGKRLRGKYRLYGEILIPACGQDRVLAWSLSALLELMPFPMITQHTDKTWICVSYSNGSVYRVENQAAPIDAAFKMVCFLKENNLTQENKKLLIIDICSRIPYKVKGLITYVNYPDVVGSDRAVTIYYDNIIQLKLNEVEIKPYLRPMSSMTEEECKELGEISATIENIGEVIPNVPYYIEVVRPEQIDWLNVHHFDYRGLIEKGLAIEVTEENNPYK